LAIADFLQLLRPHTLHQQHTARVYRAHVQAIGERVREIFDAWAAQREIERDYARLANSAAVHRWELMRLGKRAERLHPPRIFNRAHTDLEAVVTDCARACQLLANGYRFHKSEAICDGQALFLDTLQELDTLVRAVEER
jgi:hypothetical protein